MYIKIPAIILCFIFLSTTVSTAQQSDYEFYYSPDLKVGDSFIWTQEHNEISYDTGALKTISSSSFNLELQNSIEGVQATPLVSYENYFKFEINATNQAVFDSYFDYGSGSNFGKFPLIYPDYRVSGNNYFKTISSDPDFQSSGFSAAINGDNITFIYSKINFDFVFNVTTVYQINSGLLLEYTDFNENLNSNGHVYEQKKITVDSYPLRYLTQNGVTSSSRENSDLKTVDYSFLGSISIFLQLSFITVIFKQTRKKST